VGVLGLALFFGIGCSVGVIAYLAKEVWLGSGFAVGSSGRVDPGAKSGPRAADLFPYYRKGRGYLSAERFSDAHRAFTQASRLAPDDPRPPCSLGDVYQNLDRNEMAQVAYREALEIDPEYTPAIVGLAKVLREIGKNEESEALLKRVLKTSPDNPSVLVGLALNAMSLGKPEEAIPHLERYTKIRNQQAWGYERLGRAYAEAGFPQEAENAYREALSVNPKTVLCHLWLGQLLAADGRKDEAQVHLKNFQLLRHWQEMERRYKRDLMRRPDDAEALSSLALYRHLLGKNHSALATVKRALALRPTDPRLTELKSRIEKELQ
jgi:tetratricopeptide (TPR) repeat protein